ncbi:hypothetical protein N0M98_24840 [Paenibacillus doosanensis]|uniref:Uncharacterized protein n=1 Tax=Paenibacillus konkukensis TaxID=2020716 RepID=A0ABY4RYB5_9BACL|nr:MULTISPECIES: hypothetical protein [Paenibacillus]MCS7463354.1 hypothetical protein [Paenibacillus doosanensis]UQZ87661.1 hypothetical protein SK3146_06963 [Paenibacillus konkukensis]
MKNKLKAAVMPAIALSLMFLLPAAAVEPSASERQQLALPSEMAFSIPMNNFCSTEQNMDFALQLSNTSASPAQITLHLYQQDGSEFKEEGSSYRDIGSTLVPGKAASLPGHATGLYHINFGNHKQCNERVYMGTVEVNTGTASLLASGWVSNNGAFQNIVVNENKTFDLSAPAVKTETTTSP